MNLKLVQLVIFASKYVVDFSLIPFIPFLISFSYGNYLNE